MSELLPCPFCGCADIDVDEGSNGACFCQECGAMPGGGPEAWNTRAKPDHATVHEMAKAVGRAMDLNLSYPEICTALLHHLKIDGECTGARDQ